MIRYSIKGAGFLIALFALLLVFQYMSFAQQESPLDTAESFELTILNNDKSKEQLIHELNELVIRHGGTLVKVVPNQDHYKEQKDIIWFGDAVPGGRNTLVNGTAINWLEPGLTGELIHSEEMGSRPLYGRYALGGSEALRAALISWSETNGFSLDFHKQQPPVIEFAYGLIHNGVGNALMTALLLFLTTLVVWFVSQAKGRAIRLLGGVPRSRIHLEDTLSVLRMTAQGWGAAFVVFGAYLMVAVGAAQIRLLLLPAFYTILTLALFSVAFTGLFSLIVGPKAAHLTKREIPLRRFRLLGRASLWVCVIFALLIVPSTLLAASTYSSLSKDYALWSAMSNFVRLSFNDVPTDPDSLADAEQFFREMEAQDNLCLSLVIDSAIGLSGDEMGRYDHLILTDRAWLRAIGLDGESPESGETPLVKISFEELPASLSQFLGGQLSIWTNTREIPPAGMEYYELTGGQFLALPSNVGYGNTTLQAKNSLIVLVEDPAQTLNVKSFLLPSASTGNVVFKNEETLRDALSVSPLWEKISSIESFTDAALGFAQEFGRAALYYIAACVLVLVSMAFAGVMNARLWAGSHKKLIFTLRTDGAAYFEIARPAFLKDFRAILLAVVVGLFASYLLRRPDLAYLIGTAFAVAILYGLANAAGYHTFVKSAFRNMSTRKD